MKHNIENPNTLEHKLATMEMPAGEYDLAMVLGDYFENLASRPENDPIDPTTGYGVWVGKKVYETIDAMVVVVKETDNDRT